MKAQVAWIKQQPQWQVDVFVRHLNPADIAVGDVVLGTLPLHLAAEVCCTRCDVLFFNAAANGRWAWSGIFC